LVTALTAALLSHYLPSDTFNVESKEGRDVLHRLAQSAHCAAQGKVGSGFDVASATYGSCVYRRFEPKLIEQVGAVGSKGFVERLSALVTDSKAPDGREWDAIVEQGDGGVAVPKGLRLVMADVDCGSKTVGMVKKVLQWRKDEPDEASMLWTALHQANMAVGEELRRLSAPDDGDADYTGLRSKIERVRSLIRDMSRLSDVPIEPEEQAKLLDELSGVAGVVGGVVPGAGGFDALALLVKDDKSVVSALKKRIEEINASTAKESGADNRHVSLLNVREDNQGVQLENVDKYQSWIIRREDSQIEQ
jgi:phosphomevalonate kinase